MTKLGIYIVLTKAEKASRWCCARPTFKRKNMAETFMEGFLMIHKSHTAMVVYIPDVEMND